MNINKINFNAIDFETATGKRNSACSVGIVRVEKAVIVDTWDILIKPPNNYYSPRNIEIHGITPKMTKDALSFWEVYKLMKNRLYNQPIVAHNESFDRSVMVKSMEDANIPYSDIGLADKWYCTRKTYSKLGYKVCKLDFLCKAKKIELKHHDALSDTIACAKLFIDYLKDFETE